MNVPKKIFLDTSFLIRLLKTNDSDHSNALAYFKRFRLDGNKLFMSTIAIAEYGIKANINYLPYPFLNIVPFNIDHAKLTSTLASKCFEGRRKGAIEIENRVIIPNDSKMMAQAEIEQADLFIGRDDNFNSVHEYLKDEKLISFNYLDLRTPLGSFYSELDFPPTS